MAKVKIKCEECKIEYRTRSVRLFKGRHLCGRCIPDRMFYLPFKRNSTKYKY